MTFFSSAIARAREIPPPGRRPGALLALALTAALCTAPAARADFMQQGPKITGTGVPANSELGYSVALSADGNTAVVGVDSFRVSGVQVGAMFVFTRSNGVWTQQAGPLVGTGNVGAAFQGNSIAVSDDGNTLIAGGVGDDAFKGAAWVFTRSGGVWTQQGGKLIGTTDSADPQQGSSVALSADGNTAIVGGHTDNSLLGAAWVFVRSGGVWTQQGSKLVGTGGSFSFQGTSAALSADGNTAAIGGNIDNNASGTQGGAVWVFTRSGSTWTQQGNKLTVTGSTGNLVRFGASVALSSDGNTLIGGAPFDNQISTNNNIGAAWVFTRAGGVWTQQGNKLVGTGGTGDNQCQGIKVALSGDGNTAIVGGACDDGRKGAAWVYTRSGSTWTQQGNKLIGSGAVDTPQPAEQGTVAISRDGRTMLSAGWKDNDRTGAVWAFTAPAAAHDFNGDGRSDILWRDSSGNTAIWLMNGGTVSSNASLGNVGSAWSVVGQRDFDGDGRHDILWRDSSGNTAIWLMNGGAVSSNVSLGNVGTAWSVTGTADFDGDGRGDILWRDTSGNVALWLMNGGTVASNVSLGNIGASWSVAGTGDFNGDGKADILWRDTGGNVAIWLMNGGTVSSVTSLGNIGASWSVVGTGDFNGDGKSDILWRDGGPLGSGGDLVMWLMNGAAVSSSTSLGNVATSWSIAQTGDYDGAGRSDILWRNSDGDNAIWLMNGAAVSSNVSLGNVGTAWAVQGMNAD